MSDRVLSIVIPAYNEALTIGHLLGKISGVRLMDDVKKQVIVVDDCSTDKTREVVAACQVALPELNIMYLMNEANSGKGFSLRKGIAAATGELVVIQDADLEYDPRDYNKLMAPILEGHADVVYGSRLMSGSSRRILFFWHSIGNHFLTFLTNVVTNLNLTDMETGYKMFRREILQGIVLRENRFGFEPEVTLKLSRIPRVRIYEVGISYHGRTYADGKKIGWRDGVRAIWCIFKYTLISR